jgi:hypothetical protein
MVQQERRFAMVPVWVIYHPDLNHADVRVYATLSERAGRKRVAWPGHRRIASDVGMSRSTVQAAIGRLEAAGAVEVEPLRGRSHRYWLPQDRPDNRATTGTTTGPHRPDNRATTGPIVGHELEEVNQKKEAAAPIFDEAQFIADRALQAAKARKREGYDVRNVNALARTIAVDPDFIHETNRVWAHRECDACSTTGFVAIYAPGAGSVPVACDALEGSTHE